MSDTKNNKPAEGEAPEVPTPGPTASAEEVAAGIIAEAEAKAAAIVAEAEAKAKAKEETAAQSEEPTAKADPMEELVDYTAPLLPNLKKRDILVGVNGETLRIKRGVPVKIKRKFYEALQNAAQQEFAAMETRQEIQKQGEKPLASM